MRRSRGSASALGAGGESGGAAPTHSASPAASPACRTAWASRSCRGEPIAARFVYVDNVRSGPVAGLIDLFWDPARSPALAIWYLCTLFALSIAAPPIFAAAGRRIWPPIPIAAALLPVFAPAALPPCRDRPLCGLFRAWRWGRRGGRELDRLDRSVSGDPVWCFALGFLLVLAILAIPFPASLLVMDAVSMPALRGSVGSPGLSSSAWLAKLGRSLMAMHLFNTICIGVVKAALFVAFSWNGWHFFRFAPLVAGAGLFGAMRVQRFMHRPFPVLGRLAGWSAQAARSRLSLRGCLPLPRGGRYLVVLAGRERRSE